MHISLKDTNRNGKPTYYLEIYKNEETAKYKRDEFMPKKMAELMKAGATEEEAIKEANRIFKKSGFRKKQMIVLGRFDKVNRETLEEITIRNKEEQIEKAEARVEKVLADGETKKIQATQETVIRLKGELDNILKPIFEDEEKANVLFIDISKKKEEFDSKQRAQEAFESFVRGQEQFAIEDFDEFFEEEVKYIQRSTEIRNRKNQLVSCTRAKAVSIFWENCKEKFGPEFAEIFTTEAKILGVK
ncbi:hypothetical protein FZC84_21115 [Rossellomorea vietnamensis]|uniref:Uncharacterized protein n=1 Tax=Rossellomorea vietnamensis TaxID=218284 RepID=A0A5D4M3R5_9BACI|nr:hypothetical protein [Rossellomorea vietnamensis]TYR95695.1 hypothetical protein FZC84_21115 [Rossellomorea vietnamensis]